MIILEVHGNRIFPGPAECDTVIRTEANRPAPWVPFKQVEAKTYPSRLPSARPFLLGVQSLVQQHFEVRLVPQPLLGGEGSGSREVIFRQPDCDRWRRSGLAGSFAGNSRHGSLAEFARGFGLLEAVGDKVLIFPTIRPLVPQS